MFIKYIIYCLACIIIRYVGYEYHMGKWKGTPCCSNGNLMSADLPQTLEWSRNQPLNNINYPICQTI